jgi:hypothetical protein
MNDALLKVEFFIKLSKERIIDKKDYRAKPFKALPI